MQNKAFWVFIFRIVVGAVLYVIFSFKRVLSCIAHKLTCTPGKIYANLATSDGNLEPLNFVYGCGSRVSHSVCECFNHPVFRHVT